jgi:hypothetical protein
MEVAQYSIKPNVASILIPQFFRLIALCALFYAGVWVNFYLLGRYMSPLITLGVIAVLIILLIAQLLITKSRAGKHHYDFFSNRVEFYGDKLKSILYSDIQQVTLRRSVFDNFSGTGTIILSKNFRISNIRDYAEIQKYLNQLIQSYSTMRSQQISQQFSAAGI